MLPRIEKTSESILQKWRELQGLQTEGALKRFREEWLKLKSPTRVLWLQKKYPKIHHESNASIFQWAQHLKGQLERVEMHAFMTPLLNIEGSSTSGSPARFTRSSC